VQHRTSDRVVEVPVILGLLSRGFAYALLLSGATHVDLVEKGDLVGNGGEFRVEWYWRGPVQAESGQPPQYVRGVAVLGSGGQGHLAARWESKPTTLPDFYRHLNGLRSVPGTPGQLIFATVQYGGATTDLYVLRLHGTELEQINDIGGRAISLEQMGSEPELVVKVRPSDLSQIYALYAWRAAKFERADRAFPKFWSGLAESYSEDMSKAAALSPFELQVDCQFLFRAFELAGTPRMAAKPCLAARSRIVSGQSLAPNLPSEQPVQFEEEKRTAVSEINTILRRLPE
jgi:hypothetical protein